MAKPAGTLDGNPMGVANDLGREAGCNDGDTGTGDRCHEGMREIGEVGW